MKVNRSEILLKCLTIYGILLACVSLSIADNAVSDQPDLAQSTSTTSTEDGVTQVNNTLDTFPPNIFPEDQSEVNETARKILLGLANNTTDDKEQGTELNVNEASTTTTKMTIEISDASTNEPLSNSSSTTQQEETFESDYGNVSDESEKGDAESIQDDDEGGESQENELEEQYNRQVNGSSSEAIIKIFKDPVVIDPKLHGGHIALIFGLTLVGFSVMIYAGLVIWRGQLERRYGMRQRLVTEDVFYSDNQNDVRYFGL